MLNYKFIKLVKIDFFLVFKIKAIFVKKNFMTLKIFIQPYFTKNLLKFINKRNEKKLYFQKIKFPTHLK